MFQRRGGGRVGKQGLWPAAALLAAVLLAGAGVAGAQDAPGWRASLTCPPEQRVSEGVRYCVGQDENDQAVHVIVVDLASPTVRFEYVLPQGIAIRYDQSGHELERSAAVETCRDPNVPAWAGPAGGCSLANNPGQYPRLTLAQAVERAQALGAEQHGGLPLAVVINADYGAPDASHGPEGLVVAQGQRLDGAANCDDDFNATLRPWLGLAERGNGMTGLLRADIDRLPTDASPPPAWLHTGIGGGPMLVQNGTPYPGAANCVGAQPLAQPEPITGCNLNQKTAKFPNSETYSGGSCRPAPHTAAGLSRDRRWLFLAISTGADKPDVLARFMAGQLAVEEALKFDGGGSSQVWLAGQPPRTLDVGKEGRALTNFLAVYAPAFAPRLATPLDATTYLTLNEGQTATLDPTFRNDGTVAWRFDDGVALVELGLGGHDPAYPLPHDVAPGASVGGPVPADESGIHVRRVQMAQDGVPFGEPAQFLVVVIPAALREQSDELQRELERIFDEARQTGEAELEEGARRVQAWRVEEGQRLAEGFLEGLMRAAEDAVNSACAGLALLPGLVGLVLVGARRRRG